MTFLKKILLLLVVISIPANASDHADPVFQLTQESAITDLFAFPDGDQLVVILAMRRALEAEDDFKIAPYQFRIHFDLSAEVDFTHRAFNKRFGGRILHPKDVSSEASIEFQIENDGSLKSIELEGQLSGQTITRHDTELKRYAIDEIGPGINVRTGVFDDPFIFPSFYGSNVVAAVFSIPLDAFPPDQRQFLIWGNSFRCRKQVDHVGRALRTQLPRFERLNTKAPKDHVEEIRNYHDDPKVMEDVFQNLVNPLFAPKFFDEVADVMILNLDRPVKFPNGRILTDDISLLCAQGGDALFYDLSFSSPRITALAARPGDEEDQLVEADVNALKKQRQTQATGRNSPLRPTANDKPFRAEFPYLADAWTYQELKGVMLPERPRGILHPHFHRHTIVVFVLIALGILALFAIVFFTGYKIGRTKRAARKKAMKEILWDEVEEKESTPESAK